MTESRRKLINENHDLKLQLEAIKVSNSLSDCNFTGVHWDAKSLQSVQTVAQGLLNLTELFKSQNINIECMLKVESKEL